MFFDARKHAFNHHVRALIHHEKTTNLTIKKHHIFPHPLQKKPCKNRKIPLHQPHKKITKQNPPPIEKSCSRNES